MTQQKKIKVQTVRFFFHIGKWKIKIFILKWISVWNGLLFLNEEEWLKSIGNISKNDPIHAGAKIGSEAPKEYFLTRRHMACLMRGDGTRKLDGKGTFHI